MSRLHLAAIALASSALLAGCGGDDEPSGPASPTSATPDGPKAATGAKVTTDAFTFNLPADWEQRDEAAPKTYLFALDDTDDDGFKDNVNVLEEPAVADLKTVEQRETAARQGLETTQSEDIEVADPIAVDGEQAAAVSSLTAEADPLYRTYQLIVDHEDSGFVVTFSFSEDVPLTDQREIAESVAASWKWAS